MEHHIFLFKRNVSSGVFFISNDHHTIDYLYAYESVVVQKHRRAVEALLYNFHPTTKGASNEVFFEWMLPEFKFIVTDSVYTPSGKKWFEHQYSQAFSRGLKVWLINVNDNTSRQIDKEFFDVYGDLYWGSEESFKNNRFAISY